MSDRVRKNGWTTKVKRPKQRYLCKDCDRSFVENPMQNHRPRTNILPVDLICCGKKLWQDGENSQGVQRRKCRKCKTVYLED